MTRRQPAQTSGRGIEELSLRDLIIFIVALVFFLAPAGLAFQRARRELAQAERVSITTFILALSGYTALAAGVILASWLKAWPLSINPFFSRIAGATLLLVGMAVHLTARLQFRSFRMAWGLESERLITSGIYRFVRHPQNLGWGLLLLGGALLGRSGVALALTGLYMLTCAIWLPVEESALERRFGSAYRRYRACTPALIPFV